MIPGLKLQFNSDNEVTVEASHELNSKLWNTSAAVAWRTAHSLTDLQGADQCMAPAQNNAFQLRLANWLSEDCLWQSTNSFAAILSTWKQNSSFVIFYCRLHMKVEQFDLALGRLTSCNPKIWDYYRRIEISQKHTEIITGAQKSLAGVGRQPWGCSPCAGSRPSSGAAILWEHRGWARASPPAGRIRSRSSCSWCGTACSGSTRGFEAPAVPAHCQHRWQSAIAPKQCIKFGKVVAFILPYSTKTASFSDSDKSYDVSDWQNLCFAERSPVPVSFQVGVQQVAGRPHGKQGGIVLSSRPKRPGTAGQGRHLQSRRTRLWLKISILHNWSHSLI